MIVKIESDNEIVGIGEACPLPFTEDDDPIKIREQIDDQLAPFLIDKDPFDREVLHELTGQFPELFDYDSSLILNTEFKPRAFYLKTKKRIIELPIQMWRFKDKAITTYLWKMHEGKRDKEDYLRLIKTNLSDELIILGTHSWHLVDTFRKGRLSTKEISISAREVEWLLSAIGKLPIEFIRLDEYINTLDNSIEEVGFGNLSSLRI